MNKSKVAIGLLTIALAATPLFAVELNANPGPTNNGGSAGWAIFFNLEAIGPSIRVTELRTASNAGANAAFSIDVFTRTGTALGGPVGSGPGSSSDGWEFLGNAPATQGPVAADVSLPIDIPDIIVPAGSVVGVALRYNTVGPRYRDAAAYETFQDGVLQLVTGDSRTVPFTGTGSFFSPRSMVGSVTYELEGLSGTGSANPSTVPQGCSTLLSVDVFPDPDGSTGIQVTGDLSTFGGSSTQAFTETSPGSNLFTYDLVVPAGQAVGPKSIITTVSDNEAHMSNGTINLTVASAFSIVGSASPTIVDPGEQTLLTVQVEVPPCATSTGHVVTVDLSQIGGSSSQAFLDDGPGGGNGDVAAGDGIYSFLATTALETPPGIQALPVTANDAQSHTVTGSILLAVGGFFDTEINDSKATATIADCMSDGTFIQGTSTGTTITGTGALNSADYYRVKTCAAPLGIYKHRLTIESEITGHTGTIRGLSQSAGVINPASDSTAQTALTVASGDLPPRTVQWFGFGKQEEIYYRVTGVAATTEPYTATLSTTSVAPVVATQTYNPGTITLQRIAGSTADLDIWVYDSDFNAIPCYGRDSPEPATVSAHFDAGTYYVAMTNFNFANDQPSCPPETFLTGVVLDFPNAASCSSSTLNLNIGLSLTDGVNSESIPITKPGAFEIVFVRFTVGAAGCACPGDMDANTARDGLDVAGFVSAVIVGAGDCADVNGDTAVNAGDVDAFITLILSGAGCP